MFSQVYYLVQSRRSLSGSTSNTDAEPSKSSYLLMFREHFDALSYLNTHGSDLADRFGVESVPGSQVGAQAVGFYRRGHCSRPIVTEN